MSAEVELKGDRSRAPWNKGRLVGQKRPLRPKEVWAIRVRLQMEGHKRDLALFNLAIDTKLRGCDREKHRREENNNNSRHQFTRRSGLQTTVS